MKRFISLLLALTMVFCLCACKNSDDGKVQFQTDLQALVNEITFINICCDYVTNSVYKIWSNTSTDDVISTLQAALVFDDATKTPAEYADILPFEENEIDLLVYSVAQGLNPDAIDISQYKGEVKEIFIGNGEQETIALCSQLCTSYNNISEGMEHISETVKSFKDTYSESYEEEASLINEWYIESSLYADFSKNPSGTMNTYVNSMNEYQNKMSRYQKTAGMYLEG